MNLPVQKIAIIIATFAISLCTAGCVDLATINAQLAHGMNHQSGGSAMATQMDSAKPVQLGVSKDTVDLWARHSSQYGNPAVFG